MNWKLNVIVAAGWAFVGAVGFLTERWGTAWVSSLLAFGFAVASWLGHKQQRKTGALSSEASDGEP